MAAVSVTFDGTRLNDAEATTGWVADGTTPTLEPDFRYQGGNCISALVKTTEVGFYYGSASTNMSSPLRVWLAKIIQTNKDAIDGTGLQLRIGSATTAYYNYTIYSATSYPPAGGWQIVPIDPNVSGWRTGTTGTPNLAAVTYWAIRSDCNATAKTANLGMDAVDYLPASNAGLTLVGGDGADADGTFTNFVTTDEGTTNNRWGVVTTRGGILYVTGTLNIGTATATVFTDTAKTVVFNDGRFNAGFCGMRWGLNSASTNISITECSFLGLGSNQAAADTRPDYTASNTSGVLTVTDSAFRVFRNMTLTSTCTFTGVILTGGLSLTQSSATLTGLTVSGQTTGAGVGFLSSNNPGSISNSTFVGTGTSGHAITITSTGTYSFSNNQFTGYGPAARSFNTGTGVNSTTDVVTTDANHGYATGADVYYQKHGGAANMGLTDSTLYYVRAVAANQLAFYTSEANATNDTSRINLTSSGTDTHWIYSADAAVYNNSGGAVTLNITNGGGSPSIRNSSASSTTVNNAVTLTISNVIPDSEVRIFTDDGNRTELAGTEQIANGTLQSISIASGGTGYTVNDVLTLQGGTKSVAAQVTVTSVSSGVITGVSISNAGSGYSVIPSSPVTVTGGTGSGATFVAGIYGSLAYSYNYVAQTPIIVVIFHLRYKDIWLTGQKLLSTNQTIPVQQIGDRVYLNP